MIQPPRRILRLPWRSQRTIHDDVDAELAFHLDMRTQALIRLGMTSEDAQAAALREFGDVDDARRYISAVDHATETHHRRRELMHDLRQDLIYAVRTLRSAPGFAFAVIATLALGIGATTAIFSIVNGVLLKPLPFPHPERIVRLYQVNARGARESVSQPNFQDWAARTHSFDALALWSSSVNTTVVAPEGPTRARARLVTRDFFAVLGVQPALGRQFVREETRFGGRRAAIISEAFWRKHYGGSAAVLGQRLIAGIASPNDSYEIVGVLPAAATYPAGNDIWIPLELIPPFPGRTSQGWSVGARLKAGISPQAAQRDISNVSRQLKLELGNVTQMSDALLIELREQMVGDVRSRLFVLLGASAFLLLIGIANAANLLMARLALRQSELAVRVALGATTWRLTRQVLAESAVLGTVAAVLGIAFATAGVQFVRSDATDMLPRVGEVAVDWPVLLFAIVLSITVALVIGLMASWRASRRDVRDALSSSPRAMSGSRSSVGWRRGLVVLQLALTVVLLVGGAVLGRGFLRLVEVNPGFSTQRILVAEAAPTIEDRQERLRYYNTLIERVRALPGVIAVGAATGVPIAVSAADGGFVLMDDPQQPVTLGAWTDYPAAKKGHAEYRVVDGDYFRAMGIRLVSGRTFEPRDQIDAPHVALVSELLAARTWPGQNPIGKLVNFGNMDGDFRPFAVVGVVGDVRHESLASDPTPTFYAYLPQRLAASALTLVASTSGDPSALATPVRRIVHDLHPEVAVETRTIEQVVAGSIADRQFTLFVIVAFAATALILASLGVYSVVAYLVSQRTREIGIRAALGAQRADLFTLVVYEGIRLAGLGIVVGTAASIAGARVLRGLVYGVSATDPIAYGVVIAILAGVAILASWIPARRAMRVDPVEVLRSA
jgi:putative ABC transport system permease protein